MRPFFPLLNFVHNHKEVTHQIIFRLNDNVTFVRKISLKGLTAVI